MSDAPVFEIFLATSPGLEPVLRKEAQEKGFPDARAVPGGVEFSGTRQDVIRANMILRGAGRVLMRIGSFRAFHLAQLDKRARKFPWRDFLPEGAAIRVEATCRKSKIYHAGAATQRIEQAVRAALGPEAGGGDGIRILARIDDNLVTFSLDTSGEALHKRGFKEAVSKAPMRETLASLFLRQCGFRGDEPVIDPMCGSGTFVIEAAEISAGLLPGRGRSFAFERMPGFDLSSLKELRSPGPARQPSFRFLGSDRDQGAVRASLANAERAGVAEFTSFACHPVSLLERPAGPPGLIIVNPPYGARISNKKPLFGLYSAMGEVFRERFSGWRVGMITSDKDLARATKLPFLPTDPPVDHGGLKVWLFRTSPLP